MVANDPILNVHTLGPEGTNCEAAATNFLAVNNIKGRIILHDTLEDGMDSMKKDLNDSVLLGCVVYPELHNLVFKNRDESKLVGCFIFPTMPMLLAAKNESFQYNKIASHPAPVALIPERFAKKIFVNSNSVAAQNCADGMVDACITTEKAANKYDLSIIQDFGPIPMGFTLHGKINAEIKYIKS